MVHPFLPTPSSTKLQTETYHTDLWGIFKSTVKQKERISSQRHQERPGEDGTYRVVRSKRAGVSSGGDGGAQEETVQIEV